MAHHAPELTPVPAGDPAALYGRWNALLARTGEDPAPSIRAHDGDFFPETPFDHLAVLQDEADRARDPSLPEAFPVRVDIDVEQRCTARCTFCYSRPYQRNPLYRGSHAPLSLLEPLFRELAAGGTRTVRFTGGGEPLTHPEIRALLPLAHRHGLRLAVLTNGDLLDTAMVPHVLANVDHLRWSVNALEDETRKRLHRPRPGIPPLSETWRRVEDLLAQRERLRATRVPLVWATFLLLPSNLEEAVPAARRLRETGVDSVSFRPVFHDLGEPWTEDALRQLSRLRPRLEALADPPRFQLFVPRRDVRAASDLHPTEFFPHCLSRRTRTVMEATREGLQLQTCGLWRGSGRHEGGVYGRGTPFVELWRNSHLRLPPRRAPRDCERCIDVSMNTTLCFAWERLLDDPNTGFVRAFSPFPSSLRHGRA